MMQIPSYTDGSGTYIPGDVVLYNGAPATVQEVDNVTETAGGRGRVTIRTAHGSQVITTPGLDPRWGGLAAPAGNGGAP